MQIILIISTFWRAKPIIIKLHTLWTFKIVFGGLLLSTCVKVKWLLKKRDIPQSIYILYKLAVSNSVPENVLMRFLYRTNVNSHKPRMKFCMSIP